MLPPEAVTSRLERVKASTSHPGERPPELGALDCHLEGEEGDESVGWPARVTLCEAYLRGIAITDRLTADEVEAIEVAAMHPREIEEPA